MHNFRYTFLRKLRIFGCAMIQAFILTRVRAESSPCVICDRVALRQVSLRVIRFPPVRVIPAMPHAHISIIHTNAI
jgi:hypothetical protein